METLVENQDVKHWRHYAKTLVYKIFRKWGTRTNDFNFSDFQDIADMGLCEALVSFDSDKGHFKSWLYLRLLDGCREVIDDCVRAAKHFPIEDTDIGNNLERSYNLDHLDAKDKIVKYLKYLSNAQCKVVILSMMDKRIFEIAKEMNCSSGWVYDIKRKLNSIKELYKEAV